MAPYPSPASSYTLPTIEQASASPSPTATPASGAPDSTHYNYFPSSSLALNLTGEGATQTKAWVTVDTAGMSTSQDPNGKQWYRIRSTGLAKLAGPARSSMNKLDADLRNTIAMNFSRKGAAEMGPTRTIEVIMAPLVINSGYGPLLVGTGIQMSGSGSIDSFKSSSIPGNHQWSLPYRRSNGGIGLVDNTANSDLRNTYVYGSLAYSGPVVKNTTHVSTPPTTPGPPAAPAAPTPNPSLPWVSYGGGNIQLGNNGSSATYIKVNGDLTVSGSNVLRLIEDSSSGTGNSKNNIYLWVTGKLTTSGSAQIQQDGKINAVWYVGGDITVSGSSYQNGSNFASQLVINGYGTNKKATVSGSANFTGVLYAPKYDVTVSGSGDFSGSLTADTVTISGSASFHYDEDLGGGSSSALGNYSYASWFEDNSDPVRNARAADNNYYPIVY